MKQFKPRAGTLTPYATHALFQGQSVLDAFKSALGDYIELSPDFFIAGATITSAPSGSGTLYSITSGHLCFKGELMEVDAHSVLKSASQLVYIDVQDDGLDVTPVLNTDGSTDYVLRRRHAKLRVAGVYPSIYMAIDAPRKTTLDRLRNKGRLVPKNSIIPYFGPLTDFDATGLGNTDTAMDGWAICNGLNGTPDMRGMVARGATDNVPDTGAPPINVAVSGNADPGVVVGSDLVTLVANNLPPHTHPLTDSEPGIDPSGSPQIAAGSAIRIQHMSEDTEPNSTTNDPVDVKQASFSVVWLMSIV